MRCEYRSKSFEIDFASVSVLPNENTWKQNKKQDYTNCFVDIDSYSDGAKKEDERKKYSTVA